MCAVLLSVLVALLAATGPVLPVSTPAPAVVACPPSPTPTPPPATGCPLGATDRECSEPGEVLGFTNPHFVWIVEETTRFPELAPPATEYVAVDVPRYFYPGHSGVVVSEITTTDDFVLSGVEVYIQIVGKVRDIYLANNRSGWLYLLAHNPEPNLATWFVADYRGDPLPSGILAQATWSLVAVYDNAQAGDALAGWTLRIR